MKKLRVGFVGFGFIGKVHAYGYRTLPFYYAPSPVDPEFVGVCTSRPDTGRAAKDAFGFRFHTADFREVTEGRDIDAVHICTPNKFHREALLSAMKAGKHIYCEKPLAASAAEAREIVAALPGYAGVHQMTLQNRFFPATLRARELVIDGFLGEVLEFRAAYLHAGSADPKAPLKWKLSKDLGGGGVLYDLGSHIIDLVRHLVGEFASVQCATKIAFPQRPSATSPGTMEEVEAEDLAFLLVRTTGGALGVIESTKIASGAQDELRFEIHGTRGAMRFNGMDADWLEVYDVAGKDPGWKRVDCVQRYAAPASGFPTPKARTGWIRSHCACLAHFLYAVAEGRKAEPGLETGARVQEIMDAAYRSAATGRWVDCA
jgi:predicted dehydrogenase